MIFIDTFWGLAADHGDFRKSAAADFFDGHFKEAFVDVARIAFGAGDRHLVAFDEAFGGVAAADDGGNAEFTRDDGGVAGAAAAVRDDGRGLLHHRFPVRVGHVRDEDVARLDAVHFGGGFDDAHRTLTDLLTDGAALNEEAALALQRVAQLHVGALLLGLHGFGTGLQDVDLAVDAVLAPFDVHRTSVVLFNDAGELGEFDHVFVGDREAAAGVGVDFDFAHRTARSARRVEFHLEELAAERLADDRILARFKHGLVHVEFVGVDGALHDHFAEAVGSRDEDHLIEARFGVEREHHARGPLIGAAHALNARGKGDFGVREALVDAVGNGTVVVERREDFLHAGEHLIDADHVEEGFLLAGERSVGQVFRGGRRANGHGNFFLAVLEPFVEFTDFAFELGGERSGFDPAANFGAGFGQGLHVVDVERFQTGVDSFFKSAFLEEDAESFGSRGKTVGNADAGFGELAQKFAKRCILTANAVHIGHAKLTKGKNVTTLYHLCPLCPHHSADGNTGVD